jgi:tetratricopeptide (TPR) repeat protein
VLPLAVPTTAERQDRAAVAASPAVRLWCERAAAALHGFELDDANAATVVRICRRLDGLPLAIELAAARLRVLSLDDIADALDEHLEMLVASDRGVPDRHRNLRATLDWSYRLLSELEQHLLAQLSVFHGGFTLDGAAAVRAPSPGDPTTLDVVSGLVDRSLVMVAERGRPTRYRLLETVRSFAWEHLAAFGEAESVSDRHLGYLLDLAEAAESGLTGPDQHRWLDVLDGEVADLVAALRWSVGAGTSPESGLRLVSTLWRFWYLRGHYAAGRTWLDAALSAAVDAPERERAKALAAAGTFAYLQCDYPTAVQRLDAALDTYRALDDDAGTAAVLQSLGCVARERADYATSRALHVRSRQLWQSAVRPAEVARSSNFLGFVAWLEGDWAPALEECDQALDFFQSTGDAEGCAWSLIVQGGVACYSGDHDAAGELLTESRRLSETTGYREGVAWSLDLLGVDALRSGRPLDARGLLLGSLREHWELGDTWRTASVLEGLADAGSRTEEPLGACRLLGAAQALRGRLGAPTPMVEASALAALSARLAADVGDGRLASALAAGRRTPLEQVVSQVLTGGGPKGGTA